jgi:hypothetical protein
VRGAALAVAPVHDDVRAAVGEPARDLAPQDNG